MELVDGWFVHNFKTVIAGAFTLKQLRGN